MNPGSLRVIIAALIGNLLISITKFAAAAFTGSSAMLSEGIHSLVDTGNQALLLHGLKRAKRPPDAQFPFGHGKEVYFWSFVVALLIFALGSGISLYEGISHILHPTPMKDPTINYIVLGLAMIFEGVAWWLAFKEFRKRKGRLGYLEGIRRSKDPTVFVVLFEDSAAMLGLMVAFVGIAVGQVTGNPLYDGLASVIIGVILGGTAVWLAYETKGLLIGESAQSETVDSIRELAGAAPGVEHVNEVLTMHMGPEYVLANLSLEFADELAAGTIEQTIGGLTARIRAAHPRIRRVFIEAESRADAEAEAEARARGEPGA